jgi:ketose-bisphosphate aldolase
MPLVNPVNMLRHATANSYAVGAFNFVDYLTMETTVQAAVEADSPVIIQVSAGTIKRFTPKTLVGMARLIADDAPVPVALHLDHGKDVDVIGIAIRDGFNSVMYDGSHLPFDGNVEETRKIVAMAHEHGVAVEGEIGVVAGVEDDIVVNQEDAIYTTTEEATAFQAESGIDFLAPAIGTAHGFYKVKPRLNIDTLREIASQANYPLVVHGGTGLPDDVVRELVAAGGAKFNVSTQVKFSYIDGLFNYIEANRTEYHPLNLLEAARVALVEMTVDYMKLLGSAGRAKEISE